MFRSRLWWRPLVTRWAANNGYVSIRGAKKLPTADGSYPFNSRSVKIKEETIGTLGYGLLAVPIISFGLGCWQVNRRRWKLDLIEKLEERIHADPIDLPPDLRTLDDLEYRRVRVRGRFVHDGEMYIGPRSEIASGQSGMHVVTPLKLEGSDVSVLVNRGWVSRQKKNPATRQEGQPSDTVELIGVVRKTEPRPLGTKDSGGLTGPTFLYRNIEAMARSVGAAPVFIDAVAESSSPGGPLGGQTRVQLRNEHLTYIATWFGLSAATACMWYKKFAPYLRK